MDGINYTMKRPGILVPFLITLGIALLAILVILTRDVASQSRASIIQFYWDQAAANFTGRQPDSAGQRYVLRTTTYYRHVNNHGVVTGTDTTVAHFYFSWGKQDSAIAVGKAHVPIRKINLAYPNIFRNKYALNFFPNDTGGADLAIGFDNDSSSQSQPTGLVVIDRTSYNPKWLYLYYPRVPGYKRFTRSFRFAEHENFVFPDSVWEVGAISGIFTSEYYRIETGVDSVTILR